MGAGLGTVRYGQVTPITLTIRTHRPKIQLTMPRKSSAILFSIWALVLLPSLCMGGVIGHACDCASDGHNQRADSDCGHEEACFDDPCGQLLAAKWQRGQDSELILVHCIAQDVKAGSTYSFCPRGGSSSNAPSILQETRRPFAPSDIPLLV